MADRQYYNRRMEALKQARTSFEPTWRDVEEYILPGTTEFVTSDNNRGDKKSSKIINDTATYSTQVQTSGMMSGLSSPARTWFLVGTDNPSAAGSKEWKTWLEQVSKNMAGVFQRSNLYQVLPQVYSDIGSFATGAFLVLEDDTTTIRCYHQPIGSYWLGTSHKGVVDTFVREFQMTARQMVQKFGKECCSAKVCEASERNEDCWFDVVHFIEANPEFDPERPHAKHKPFRSVYYEPTCDHTNLSESGFDEFPAIAARWSVRGSGIYGNLCPGFQCLGDVKALQLGEKRGWQAVDKMVNPPMGAPSSLRNTTVSQLPGSLTFFDVTQGGQGVKPLWEMNPRIAELDGRLNNLERRIQRAYHVDLFLMVSQMEGAPPTAAEINMRREEKMLMLGPTLERLNDELFDPLIKRVFGIMWRKSETMWGTPAEAEALIPPPPGQPPTLVVEYISILAQAQKLVGTANLEKMTAFVGNLMGMSPDALDKFDIDQAIDEYAEMVGAGPKTIRDAKEVAQIRQARAQEQQAQKAMAMAQAGAQTAKDLGTTPVTEDTALGAILGRMGMPS